MALELFEYQRQETYAVSRGGWNGNDEQKGNGTVLSLQLQICKVAKARTTMQSTSQMHHVV
eukprot:CAMPEP_0172881694 /NCGR_PEP_ID=MMETSP1075-20121228/118166_1 /TAXON_ID=2916 /ORGANISM="Ceratium fusus, Strain PA161109" /LENGTH=60 /DNA_ID=CAMNT_0013734211 /DNA_START=9 /DNA_END=192 /DNA_ORIENTATION=+